MKRVQSLQWSITIGVIICIFSIVPINQTRASEDSLNLAQCFANLSVTNTYFDSLPNQRLAKIIPYMAGELSSITDSSFINSNAILYNITRAHLHFLQARFMFKNRTKISRDFLLKCKTRLDSAIFFFNESKANRSSDEENDYYTFAGYNYKLSLSLRTDILKLKEALTLYFNKDIYPDFKRIFYAAKNRKQYYFDSLKYYAGLYNMPLDFFIKENRERPITHVRIFDINTQYNLSPPLDLISQFLQFHFLIHTNVQINSMDKLYGSFQDFKYRLNPKSDTTFGVSSNILKDNFFRKELNAKQCNELYKQLKKKFAEVVAEINPRHTALPSKDVANSKYYFPIPAPFPSSKYAINHFAPQLKTMQQVNDYIRRSFNDAGYAGRLHYYYIKYPGFAVATDIERINKDGSPTKEEERWNLKMSNDGKFSLYQVFKSIFFATESDFRMIACIIAPQEIETDNKKKASASEMADLLKNSYSSLPVDLEKVGVDDKTLTILVYHFNQSDIGEVPVLASSDKLVVPQHFKKTSPLDQLIK